MSKRMEAILDKIDLNDLMEHFSVNWLSDVLNVSKHTIKSKAFKQKEKLYLFSKNEMKYGMNNEWLKSKERILIKQIKNIL